MKFSNLLSPTTKLKQRDNSCFLTPPLNRRPFCLGRDCAIHQVTCWDDCLSRRLQKLNKVIQSAKQQVVIYYGAGTFCEEKLIPLHSFTGYMIRRAQFQSLHSVEWKESFMLIVIINILTIKSLQCAKMRAQKDYPEKMCVLTPS